MPKSFDDPSAADLGKVERDRIELARLNREREARRTHPAYEPSEAPPPPPYRERQPSIVDIELESHGKRASHIKSILALAATVIAGLVAAGVWVQSRPNKDYVDAAETRAKAAAGEKNAQIQYLSESNARIEQQVKDMRENDDKRWDKLDKILERQFGQSTSATPPPSFGPAAKAKGKQ